ncbi:hypothetical protein [Pseudofrankia sp. DC12]|uniref:hypothetical protein n=1 Tax=Pseudofrankia sp. DC12 TaxID=683315 RepID=UPI0005F83DB8|nr:hypothetical protein [Pseudofrankia sp. DC12]
MIAYRCPRADLGCDSDFATSGDLDNHLHWQHGYRRSSRYAAAFRPAARPVGGQAAVTALAARRAAQTERAAVGTRGFGPGATRGATRARRTSHASAGRLRRLARHG